MTNAQERAKVLAEQIEELRVMDHEGTTLNQRGIEALLSSTLAQVEAETWERAALELERLARLRIHTLSGAVEVIEHFHQQARRAKEGIK